MSASPNPHAPTLTAEQRRAAELFGGDVVVSASAGTGKTSVLAARALRLAADPDSGCAIDQLLIVTFTRAAAAEMRRRIAAGLAERTGPDAAGRHAERQLVLLDRADVCTLHAFCRRVVREESRELGLDPAWKLLPPSRAEGLRRAAAVAAFEAAYADPGEAGRAFREWADRHSGPLSDDNLIETVLRLERFVSSLPDAEGWLKSAESGGPSFASMERELRTVLLRELSHLVSAASRVGEDLAVAGLLTELEKARSAASDGTLNAALAAVGRLGGVEFLSVPVERRAEWEAVRRRTRWLAERYGGYTTRRLTEGLAASAPSARALADAVRRVTAEFSARKAAETALDLADLERLAHRLLSGRSGVARRWREKYRYILVDEYQDLSPLQEAILSAVSAGDGAEGNRFLVGDVKQSIYGFRHADPSLMAARSAATEPQRRVELTANFRAGPGLVSAVNALMSRLMTRDSAGADFTPAVPAVPVTPDEPDTRRVEVHFLDADAAAGAPDEEETGLTDEDSRLGETRSAQREADFVADRIRRMVASAEFAVSDPAAAGGSRPVRWRDVVILLRAVRGRAEVYADALSRAGVPVAADAAGRDGSVERRDLANLLRVLDNPRRDRPLAGLLRSPLIGLSDADLVRIRLAAPEADLLSALAESPKSEVRSPKWDGPDVSADTTRPASDFGLRTSDSGLFDLGPPDKPRAPDRPEDLPHRAGRALETLERWRTAWRTGPASAAVALVFRETGWPDAAAALPGGRRRRAELLSLLERLRRMERAGTPAAEWADEIDRDDDSAADADLGPEPAAASSSAGGAPAEDAVRVLSVHRAKGLEFPVVVMPDLGRRFNFRDAEGDLLWTRRHGVAAAVVDPAAGTRTPTLPHLLAAEDRRSAARAEELRLLYVGLTRARERLVLTAGVTAKTRARFAALASPKSEVRSPKSEPLPADNLLTARAPADWLLPAVVAGGPDMPTESLRSDVQPVPAKSTPPLPSDFGLRTSDFGLPAAERLVGRVLWEYPHARLAGTASQASVTGLAKAGRPDRPAAPPKPAFLAEKPSAVGPADIGTAVHVLMRHVDLATPAGRIDEPVLRGLLDSLIERGLIPEGLRGKLPLARVLAFFRSEPGRTMLARPADVLREVPVTFTVPASALDPGLPMPDAAEPVMVRGAVDALIRLPGGAGFWLLDYKTDAAEPGSDPAAAAARHRTQLELYRRAVAEAWGRPVPRATLCLLTLGECIDL